MKISPKKLYQLLHRNANCSRQIHLLYLQFIERDKNISFGMFQIEENLEGNNLLLFTNYNLDYRVLTLNLKLIVCRLSDGRFRTSQPRINRSYQLCLFKHALFVLKINTIWRNTSEQRIKKQTVAKLVLTRHKQDQNIYYNEIRHKYNIT